MRRQIVSLYGDVSMTASDFQVLMNIDKSDAARLRPLLDECITQLRKLVPAIVKMEIRGEQYIKVYFNLDSDAQKLIETERPNFKSDLTAHLVTQMNVVLNRLLG